MKGTGIIFWAVAAFSLLLFTGCQEEEYQLGTLVIPSGITLEHTIFGADADHPYGDGSGLVSFTAAADHAITYTYTFGDGKDQEIAPSGQIFHTFSKTGIHPYSVTVYAVGTGGLSSSVTIEVEVYSSFTDEEAEQFLSGGSTKIWYWAADQPGHLGLGPNDQAYTNGEHTYSAWYSAAPWEKTGTSLYFTECAFTLENGNLTFEQINPTGQAFIQGLYAAELGLGPEGSYEFDISGIKNVSFGPSASIATEDGGYRGTTMNFSDAGFMGFYAGSSEYEIIEISENILRVRMVQSNEPLFAWYHTFTPVKPQ
jgi:hypothetical protein